MQEKKEKPTVRVIKGGGRNRPRGGAMTVQGKDGETYWRIACDRCSGVATVSFRPTMGREVACEDCYRELNKAKPSTRAIRKKDRKTVYVSECDECGDEVQTSFVPFRDKYLQCNGCRDASREEALKAAKLARQQEQAARSLDEPRPSPEAEAGLEVFPDEVARDEPLADSPAEGQSLVPEPDGEITEPDGEITEPDAEITESETESEPELPAAIHEIPCNKCGKVQSLRFQPSPKTRFLCPDCYQPDLERPRRPDARPYEKGKRTKSETRIFFNFDCASCGKLDTLDFVPSRRSEAICNECFNKLKERSK